MTKLIIIVITPIIEYRNIEEQEKHGELTVILLVKYTWISVSWEVDLQLQGAKETII